jgi:hypothetical protein
VLGANPDPKPDPKPAPTPATGRPGPKMAELPAACRQVLLAP